MSENKSSSSDVKKIIDVANKLISKGRNGAIDASTSEIIAATFVLNNMRYLPASYRDVVEAWDSLGEWQRYVRFIKTSHMDLIDPQVGDQPMSMEKIMYYQNKLVAFHANWGTNRLKDLEDLEDCLSRGNNRVISLWRQQGGENLTKPDID